MAKEFIELNDQALADAAEVLGTSTSEETINAALLEVAERRRERRLAAFDRLCEMGRAGDFDILLDKRNYRR